MLKNIIIKNPAQLEQVIAKIKQAGADNFHVIADFDRTLTKGMVKGQKSPTVIAQIRNGGYLTPNYASQAFALYNKYHVIEIDPKLSRQEKIPYMHQWWSSHFKLLSESGLTLKLMQDIVKKKTLKFRTGALEFIDSLHELNIPLLIMSAAPGEMIKAYLRQENRLYNNIHIIANFYEFDKNGKSIKINEPIIHSMNKYEMIIKDFPIYKKISNRKNIILLGDLIADTGMVEGFAYDNLIKVGFLNYKVEENLADYKKNFDIVITNDSDMNYINNLIKKLF